MIEMQAVLNMFQSRFFQKYLDIFLQKYLTFL